MSKFLFHKDTMLYSTHGELSAQLLFDASQKEKLADNFYAVGFYRNGEAKSHVLSVKPVEIKKCYKLYGNGVGMQRNEVYLYDKQKMLLESGEIIEIKDIRPNMFVVGLNGKTVINKVEMIEAETPLVFYEIETEDSMQNLYGTNIIMFNIDNDNNASIPSIDFFI